MINGQKWIEDHDCGIGCRSGENWWEGVVSSLLIDKAHVVFYSKQKVLTVLSTKLNK